MPNIWYQHSKKRWCEMGTVVWINEEESYCNDCGTRAITRCDCTECAQCGIFTDAVDEIDGLILCIDCIEKMREKNNRRRQRKRLRR